ncbi:MULTISPECIES: hypothetical protein [Nitrosomonas]|nr:MULTISPECIES: hypothetical protein [Nitrosomonas]UVS61987.1 hypothetical protein NX761_02320 [Nitrosomonas sp. PLL12]
MLAKDWWPQVGWHATRLLQARLYAKGKNGSFGCGHRFFFLG